MIQDPTINNNRIIQKIDQLPNEEHHLKKDKIDPIKNDKIDPKITQEVEWGPYVVTSLALLAGLISCGVVIAELVYLIKESVEDKIWHPNPKDLENRLSKKFSSEFINKVKSVTIEGVNYVRLFKRLTLSKDDEVAFLSYLETHFDISMEEFQQILVGAHVRLEDNGKAYAEWVKTMNDKKLRLSSHPSDQSQYAIQGTMIKELLFSRLEDNGNTYTWFQLENHPVSLGYMIRHMKDYMKYLITSENQGPYGSSKATHNAPIILKFKQKS